MDGIEGKVLKNEKGEEYLVLNEIIFESLKCAYAVSIEDNEKKAFFQVSDGKLLSIRSKKMISDITKVVFNGNEEIPRNIKNDESISDYFNYLDEFYKKSYKKED